MDCHKVKKILPYFLERSLSDRIKEELDNHFKQCAGCQREKELFSKSWEILGNYTAPELRHDFTPSLMKRIHLEQAKIIKVSFKPVGFNALFSFRKLAPVCASFLIVISIFYLSWRKQIIDNKEIFNVAPVVNQEIIITAADAEIIQNLDIIENMELLENFDLLNSLDGIKNLELEAT